MILSVRDETANGRITNRLSLDVLTERITVRELIRSRVYQEVQDFNRKRATTGEFKGLVTPIEKEQAINSTLAHAVREIDWKQQFELACEAFERNGFFIIIDNRQAESLDEEITLRHDTQVSFVKLTPLVGG